MRYVKQIIHNTEGYIPHARLELFRGHPVSVMVHDTERNSDSICSVYKLCDELGAAVTDDGRRVIVRMDNTALKIHEFVRVARSEVPAIAAFPKDDAYRAGRKTFMSARNSDTLAYCTDGPSVVFEGQNGCCVLIHGTRSDPVQVMSIPELLVKLCAESGLNVMKYDKMRIGSSGHSLSTELTFTHNQDADLLYLKLFLMSQRKAT